MILRLLIVCALLLGQPCFGAVVKDLFKADAIALSQEPADRKAAIQEALLAVLHRIVIADVIESDPTVKAALNRAEAFVSHESYSRVNNEYRMDTLAKVMHVEFNEADLIGFLKDGGLTVWEEASRPDTLVWLQINDHGIKRLFNPNAMPEWHDVVLKAAQGSGLSLKFPSSKLKNQQLDYVNSMLASDPAKLLKSSAASRSTPVLTGELVNRDWCWEPQWTFYFNEQMRQWTGSCGTRLEALEDGIRGAYQGLSKYQLMRTKADQADTKQTETPDKNNRHSVKPTTVSHTKTEGHQEQHVSPDRRSRRHSNLGSVPPAKHPAPHTPSATAPIPAPAKKAVDNGHHEELPKGVKMTEALKAKQEPKPANDALPHAMDAHEKRKYPLVTLPEEQQHDAHADKHVEDAHSTSKPHADDHHEDQHATDKPHAEEHH